jgi:hypothetical protein
MGENKMPWIESVNNGFDSGFYCDTCDAACCNSHEIICGDCYSKLMFELETLRNKVKKFEEIKPIDINDFYKKD